LVVVDVEEGVNGHDEGAVLEFLAESEAGFVLLEDEVAAVEGVVVNAE
jgi:hypothetical protein